MTSPKLKPFRLTAEVTISVHAVVWAKSKKDALAIADNLPMASIHQNEPYVREGESYEEWFTSGELDGEAKNVKAELDV